MPDRLIRPAWQAGPVKRFWVACLVLAACGADDTPEPPKDLIDQLQAIPGITVEQTETDTPGVTYFVLHFTQPVDHEAPDGQTFQQEVSLLHRGLDAPMIVQTSGYYDYYLDHPVELTNLLISNQISIEHRFFGASRPDPADWSKLTIKQMADDEHAIIAALRKIYPGAFLTTGGSKGGMTATYHRRFYPDDVDGSVPYVAPISFGAPDDRYTAFVDGIGPSSCRTALRAAAVEMLQRRAAMESRAGAQPGHSYSRIAIGPAVEVSIASLEWAFWQYWGVDYCGDVPATTASDDDLFGFLDAIAPIGDSDDDQVAAFEAYYYQAYAQLGYPADNATYLEGMLLYTDADYDGALPTPDLPAYDEGAAMTDIDQWVQTEGDRLLFIYGEFDPWSGGKYSLGAATDSLLLVQAEGSHGSRINRLADADRDLAFAKLEAWTGVKPLPPIVEKPSFFKEPRVPPVLIRLLSKRR